MALRSFLPGAVRLELFLDLVAFAFFSISPVHAGQCQFQPKSFKHLVPTRPILDGVADQPAFPPTLHQVRVSENSQTMGHPGLLVPEDVDEFADAKRFLQQQPVDPQSRFVGECLEDLERSLERTVEGVSHSTNLACIAAARHPAGDAH